MKATVSSLSRKRVEKTQKVVIHKPSGSVLTTLNKNLGALL